MLIIIEYKELCCLISSSRVTFSRDLIKSILVLSRVAGWAVGLFKYFFGGVRQGKFFFVHCQSLVRFRNFFSNWQLLNPIPIFDFSADWQLLKPDSDFFFRFFSARWQLLNPTPFSFSEPQVAVAETDSEIFRQSNRCRNRHRVFLFTEFRNSGSCGCRNRIFFSLEIFRHSTAISPKRKLVGLLFG